MSTLQNELWKKMTDFTLIVKQLSGKTPNIKDISNLNNLKNNISDTVKSILNNNQDDIDWLENFLSWVENLYNGILGSFLNYLFEENRQLLEQLENIAKTDVTDGAFWNICNKLNDKIEKSWDKNFDNIIHWYLDSTIWSIFEDNKQIIIDQIIKKYNYSEIDTLKTIFNSFENVWYITTEFFAEIRKTLTDKYIQTAFPELKKKIDIIYKQIEKNITENDIIWFDPNKIKDTFNEYIQEIMIHTEAGSDIEKQLKNITDEFETIVANYTSEIIKKYFDKKIVLDIQDFDSKTDFDEYENTPDFKSWIEKIDYFIEKEILEKKHWSKITKWALKKAYLEDYENLKKEVILKNIWKIISIKQKWGIVHFGNIEFPIYSRNKQKWFWTLDPKITGNTIALNIKEFKTKTIIKPTDKKKLRLNNPYELSREEYKELLKNFDNFKKSGDCEEFLNSKKSLIKKLNELRLQNKEKNDSKIEKEIIKIESQLKEINIRLNQWIPHIFRVLETLNKLNLNNYWWIPSLTTKIKITPDVLNNISKVISLVKDQLIRQDWIGILEWEAWVGKNVLIDIFAHYTNRPVFTFPCNKRASKEDLTYQWLIDENGTYKLHSKVYEAIKTPWAILIFDEINTLPPEMIKVLNGLFDYRRTLTMPYDNEYEKSKDDVVIFGTQNPEYYVGTNKPPQDSSSRFSKIYIDYPELETTKEWVPFTTFDEGMLYAEGKYPGTDNYREGIVIRPTKERYSPVLKSKCFLPIITPSFLKWPRSFSPKSPCISVLCSLLIWWQFFSIRF